MKFVGMLLALLCVPIVAASGAEKEGKIAGRPAVNSSDSMSARLMTVLGESRVAVLFTVAMIVGVYVCSGPSGSTAQRHVSIDEEPVAPLQKHEARALAYVAQGKHGPAARSYGRAAVRCNRRAAALKGQSRLLDAAQTHVKAAAMFAAGSAQSSLAAFGVCALDGDKYAERYAMHLATAQCCSLWAAIQCYWGLATAHAKAGDRMQARAMGLAAAAQCEAGAVCALAFHGHEVAADFSSLACKCYRLAGEQGKAESAKDAEGRHREAHAAVLLAQGDREHAGRRQCRAAKAFEAAGNLDKARALSEAAAKHFEACAVQPEVQSDQGRVARHYRSAATAHEAARQPAKARPLWRAAARSFEAKAVAEEGQANMASALLSYRHAAGMYEKVDDWSKTRSMKEAIARLEIALQPSKDGGSESNGGRKQ